MPLRPGDNWDVDEEVAEATQKFLGNMALTKENQNRELANRPFVEKRPIYAESGYNLTKEISQYEEWTVEQIKERQARMAQLAVKTWPLDFKM